MEQLDLFRPDMAEARRQADAAIERAYNGADPEWKAAAAWAVFYVAKNKRVFTGDDVWAVGLPRPREPRALGPIMLRAAKKGLIRKTGRMVPSAVPKDHMNPHYEWESLIFE